MLVRHGEISDIAWLQEQLKLFSEFYDTKTELYDEGYSEIGIRTIIKDHVLLIAENKDGERLGFIAGFLTPHSFNPKIIVLSEVFWWVAEKYRGTSRAGLLLLKSFIEIGRERADWITMSLAAKSPVNDRILEKYGFELHERNFLLEMN